MHTQTYSRPIHIPTLIREIRKSELHLKSDPPKIIPYLELYHNSSSPRPGRFLSVLHRNLKKSHKDHFHSSTYKHNQNLAVHRKSFIEAVRSELDDQGGLEKNQNYSNSKPNRDSQLLGNLTNLVIMPAVKPKVKNQNLFKKLPAISKSVDFSADHYIILTNQDDIITKDASCNT